MANLGFEYQHLDRIDSTRTGIKVNVEELPLGARSLQEIPNAKR